MHSEECDCAKKLKNEQTICKNAQNVSLFHFFISIFVSKRINLFQFEPFGNPESLEICQVCQGTQRYAKVFLQFAGAGKLVGVNC